jgi:predicted site-specific integrase-resolvase
MMEVTEIKGQSKGTRDRESRAFLPRLMNLHEAADYLGVSYYTMRDYVKDGIVPQVQLPCSRRRKRGGAVVRRAGDIEARRIYIDRVDLDALVEKCKQQSEQAQYN